MSRKHKKPWARLGMLMVLTTEVVLIGTVLYLRQYGTGPGGIGPDGVSPGNLDTDTGQAIEETASASQIPHINIGFPSLHTPETGTAFPRLHIPDVIFTFAAPGGKPKNHTGELNPPDYPEPENAGDSENANTPDDTNYSENAENASTPETINPPENPDSGISEPESFFVQAGNFFTNPEELVIDEFLPVIEYTPVSYTNKLPVLMYHHVVRDGEPLNEMCVTVSRLETDLQWLIHNGYHTVLPYELAMGMPLPDKPILITFDDGYASNYELLYPLLQKYQVKAVISVIVCMVEGNAGSFLSWEMCREMIASGLVEIGSHTYQLHNPETNGMFNQSGANGIQRKADESDESYSVRVLNDIRKSYEVITARTGQPPTFFAYPFGKTDPAADALVQQLFPVSVITLEAIPNLQNGLQKLPRLTVMMDEPLKHLVERVERKS